MAKSAKAMEPGPNKKTNLPLQVEEPKPWNTEKLGSSLKGRREKREAERNGQLAHERQKDLLSHQASLQANQDVLRHHLDLRAAAARSAMEREGGYDPEHHARMLHAYQLGGVGQTDIHEHLPTVMNRNENVTLHHPANMDADTNRASRMGNPQQFLGLPPPVRGKRTAPKEAVTEETPTQKPAEPAMSNIDRAVAEGKMPAEHAEAFKNRAAMSKFMGAPGQLTFSGEVHPLSPPKDEPVPTEKTSPGPGPGQGILVTKKGEVAKTALPRPTARKPKQQVNTDTEEK